MSVRRPARCRMRPTAAAAEVLTRGWARWGFNAKARRSLFAQPPDRRDGCENTGGNAALDVAGEVDRGLRRRSIRLITRCLSNEGQHDFGGGWLSVGGRKDRSRAFSHALVSWPS